MNTLNLRFKKKLNEVYFITPNNLGVDFLTHFYKRLTKPMKVMPFLYVIPLSFLFVILVYLIFGILTVKITSLLQYGF